MDVKKKKFLQQFPDNFFNFPQRILWNLFGFIFSAVNHERSAIRLVNIQRSYCVIYGKILWFLCQKWSHLQISILSDPRFYWIFLRTASSVCTTGHNTKCQWNLFYLHHQPQTMAWAISKLLFILAIMLHITGPEQDLHEIEHNHEMKSHLRLLEIYKWGKLLKTAREVRRFYCSLCYSCSLQFWSQMHISMNFQSGTKAESLFS